MGKSAAITPLTSSEIFHLVTRVQDGTASPDDAKQLLIEFCERVDMQEGIPRALLIHLRDAFDAALGLKKVTTKARRKPTLYAALGLAKRGRPPTANEDVRKRMAAAVLGNLLAKKNHQEALSAVSGEFHCAESVVGEAWAAWGHEAYIQLRLERPLTGEEVNRLEEIKRKSELNFERVQKMKAAKLARKKKAEKSP